MNLLPKSAEEFSTSDYWDKFFKNRGKKAFEWYGEYPELCGILHKYITTKNRVLNVGCGNSRLPIDLYDVSGIRNIVNIDVSSVVIKQMTEANKARTEMQWLQMDATDMTFDSESFTVVLDKGTLDALFTDEKEETLDVVQKYLDEVSRVLSCQGGRYICISLLQTHILKFLVKYLPTANYMLRIIRCHEAEATTNSEMPVFVIVATKFRDLPNKIYETCLAGTQIVRLKSPEETTDAIEQLQKASMIAKGLSRDSSAAKDEVEMQLFAPGNENPRFTVHVVDAERHKKSNMKFACFIVPQGRETEWIFSTKKGRQKLLEQARHDRLAIISMHREHNYPSWSGVQSELDPYVVSLAPQGLKDKVAYLSVGHEDVGQRELICKGNSELSGAYLIEDVTIRDRIYRRLIFLQNQATIQSEAALSLVRAKDGSIMEKRIDKTYLACDHHLYMTIGLQFVHAKRALLIGLGGGGLCTFVSQIFKLHLTAVELDPAILHCATEFFGLTQSKYMTVQVQDGIEYLKNAPSGENASFDAILFDVDGKDPKIGMSCPPKEFLADDIIEAVQKLIGNTGIFILNLVCRDETLKDEVIVKLKTQFTSVCSYSLEEDLNEVVYCRTVATDWSKMDKSIRELNNMCRKNKISRNDMIDCEDFMKTLKLE